MQPWPFAKMVAERTAPRTSPLAVLSRFVPFFLPFLLFSVRGPVMIGQTDPERRALRSEQRALNDRISACSTELGHLGSDMFDKISSMNNRLFKRVRYTREAVHDADNLKAISQHAVRRAESLGSSVSPYSASKLVRALHSKLLDPHTGSFDWHMLGVAAGVCFNSLPSTEFMLGPIGQTTPEKAAKVGKAPDASRSEADDAPVETIHADLSGARREENTNRRMATLRRLIEDREREDSRGLVDLFRLTSNPSSFTQTVENVFDFSFLIKDGRARLKIDAKTGVPVTQLTKPPEKAHIHNQLVVAFNMRDWRNICNAQQLAAGDVPHRNDPCYAPEAR